jgi:hypothetical protein
MEFLKFSDFFKLKSKKFRLICNKIQIKIFKHLYVEKEMKLI